MDKTESCQEYMQTTKLQQSGNDDVGLVAAKPKMQQFEELRDIKKGGVVAHTYVIN